MPVSFLLLRRTSAALHARAWPIAGLVLSAACTTPPAILQGGPVSTAVPMATATVADWPWQIRPGVADQVSTQRLAPSVVLHTLSHRTGPWRASVLDIDLAGCVSVRSVKGSRTAVGRTTTSALLTGLPASTQPIGAVNADFFIFTPPGVPSGAQVENGRVIAGPGPGGRPVFGMDSTGKPFISVARVSGTVSGSRGDVPLVNWNRPSRSGWSVVDASWGAPLDTALLQHDMWRLVPARGGAPARRYVLARTRSLQPPTGDTLYLVGGRDGTGANARLVDGDTVTVSMTFGAARPREVVGGLPILVTDSLVQDSVDVAGTESFRGLNPRTAVGIAERGRRLLLVVVDGRQRASAGMTVRQTADLMRALGAHDAVNLDGGGSSAMAITERGRARVVTRPSDAGGERAVGNALAVVGTCEGR